MASSSSFAAKYHHVFLSFRGEDTRDNFISHLYAALCRKKIETFIDNDLLRGDEISSSLLKAIEESKIAIIIFSKGYATSRWCLEELAKILECQKSRGMMVVPVFYHVDPSDVRHQTGAFEEAFVNHEQRFQQNLEKVQQWRVALTEAANLSGFDSKSIRTESALIEEIVKNVLKRVNHMSPSVNKDLVGVESSINKIESLLRLGSKEVFTVGIWGMGGIGKTTLAQAVYVNILSQFESYYFQNNVREESEKHGLTHLSHKLLSVLLEDESAILESTFTKNRLCNRKILIVFDDVTCLEQIEKLIGDLGCFGCGSRIIITTRDKHVLKNCGVDDKNIFEVKKLPNDQALQLFSRHAFKQNHLTLGFMGLSERIVTYARGVPLALKVLGGLLVGRTKQEWKSAIHKLERYPNSKIMDALKISYDGLDEQQKIIFLDVACFFKGVNKNFVIEFLNANGLDSEIDVHILIDKSLIVIEGDKITMHDLLQEMGKNIVNQESKDLGKRSRLWNHEDIYHVLRTNTGTENIEGLRLDMSKIKDINLKPDAFLRMHKLRLLDFCCCNQHLCAPFKLFYSFCSPNEGYENKVHALQSLEFGSTELSYFRWFRYPLNSLPLNFDPQHLVTLFMPYSNIEQILNVDQGFDKLKHVDLSYSKHLTRIPDLSLTPNLETLILEGCTSLIEVPSSIQYLKKLITLDLSGCKSLCSLPTSFQSKYLMEVSLSGCSNLRRAPKISHNMKKVYIDGKSMTKFPLIEHFSSLHVLHFENCSRLKRVPIHFCQLKSLRELSLSGCSNLKRLPSYLALSCQKLMRLDLSNCQITKFPNIVGQLSFLEWLCLRGNKFECIPSSIGRLSKLCYLDVSNCERLQFLPELQSHWRLCVQAYNCTSLEVIPESILSEDEINLGCCLKLDQNLLKASVENTLLMFKPKLFGERRVIFFPGNEIPECFGFQNMGSSITFEIPQDYRSKNSVWLGVCVVVTFEDHHEVGSHFPISYKLITRDKYGNRSQRKGGFRSKHYCDIMPVENFYLKSDHVLVLADFFGEEEEGDVEIDFRGCLLTVDFSCDREIESYKVKKCSVKLLGYHKDIRFRRSSLLNLENEEEEEEPQPKRLKFCVL